MTREQAHRLRHTIASRLRAEALRLLDYRNPLDDWEGLTSYGDQPSGTVEPLEDSVADYLHGVEDGSDCRLAIVITVADSCDVTAEGEEL